MLMFLATSLRSFQYIRCYLCDAKLVGNILYGAQSRGEEMAQKSATIAVVPDGITCNKPAAGKGLESDCTDNMHVGQQCTFKCGPRYVVVVTPRRPR